MYPPDTKTSLPTIPEFTGKSLYELYANTYNNFQYSEFAIPWDKLTPVDHTVWEIIATKINSTKE